MQEIHLQGTYMHSLHIMCTVVQTKGWKCTFWWPEGKIICCSYSVKLILVTLFFSLSHAKIFAYIALSVA